jgi:hypothetical protein
MFVADIGGLMFQNLGEPGRYCKADRSSSRKEEASGGE